MCKVKAKVKTKVKVKAKLTGEPAGSVGRDVEEATVRRRARHGVARVTLVHRRLEQLTLRRQRRQVVAQFALARHLRTGNRRRRRTGSDVGGARRASGECGLVWLLAAAGAAAWTVGLCQIS